MEYMQLIIKQNQSNGYVSSSNSRALGIFCFTSTMHLFMFSSSSTPSSALASLSSGPIRGESLMSSRYQRVYGAVNIRVNLINGTTISHTWLVKCTFILYSYFVELVDQIDNIKSTSWQWKGTLKNSSTAIPYMTSLVHIYPIFILCQPVDQVNNIKLTSWHWMCTLKKSSTAIHRLV